MAGSERSGPLAATRRALRRPAVGGDPARRRPTRTRSRWSRRWSGCAAPYRSGSARWSTTAPWPGPRTSRTCSPRWSRAGWPTRPADHLALSGQGVRDVTRVAAGDPALYGQIVAANSEAVARPARRGPRPARRRDRRGRRRRPGRASRGCSSEGVAGTRAIPGKHGGPTRPTALGLRLGARPPGRAGPAVRRRRRQRGQHRGRPHRPRPRPAGRSGRAAGRRGARRAPAGVSRIPGLGDPPVGLPACEQLAHRRPASSSRSTAPPDRASRARRAAWPTGSGCATSTPARCTAR